MWPPLWPVDLIPPRTSAPESTEQRRRAAAHHPPPEDITEGEVVITAKLGMVVARPA